jgi:hypothetical protein
MVIRDREQIFFADMDERSRDRNPCSEGNIRLWSQTATKAESCKWNVIKYLIDGENLDLILSGGLED